MNILKPLLFSFCFLLLFGCKKERLKPTDEMVGEWEWVYSRYYFESYAGMHQWNKGYIYYRPEDLGYEASLKILENGKVLLSKNGEEFYKMTSRHAASIMKYNDKESLVVNGDTITGVVSFIGFPFVFYDESHKMTEFAITSKYYSSNPYAYYPPIVTNYFKKK
jgi:hypothetical protein